MKKKGFTLIELLAVIVILAIIALIATPLVLKYIETSRANSKITSTQNYIKGVETALASYSITNKGKSYPSGCYDITTLNTDLEISVKGDIPSEGKVCIENNKVEKVMVKYPDNKIIKYENDKSTISDEETYESFNSVSNYIIDADVEFAYDDSQKAYVATLPITKDFADKLRVYMDYDYIIDNSKTILLYGFEFPNNGFILYSEYSNEENIHYIIIEDEKLIFITTNEIVGKHNIKLGNSRQTQERMFFMVYDEGSISMTSYDFILGNANILIKDSEGNEYYNNVIELEKNTAGTIGADNGCRGNLTYLPEVYTALKNGKTITIEVTQIVDGKEIVSTISRNIDSMVYLSGRYMSSAHVMAMLSNPGC